MEQIPVQIQHRHIHLSQEDCVRLFGDSVLTKLQSIGHRGQFVAKETLALIGEKGTIHNVRVVGPSRAQTQVELSATDAFAVGINAPVRLSGDLMRAGTCRLRGPFGEIECTQAVIIPARHLHVNDQDARRLLLTQGQIVTVAPASRPTDLIEHVTVRVHPTFQPALHLTTDEAASLWLADTDFITLL